LRKAFVDSLQIEKMELPHPPRADRRRDKVEGLRERASADEGQQILRQKAPWREIVVAVMDLIRRW
jgi:ribosomal protein L34